MERVNITKNVLHGNRKKEREREKEEEKWKRAKLSKIC